MIDPENTKPLTYVNIKYWLIQNFGNNFMSKMTNSFWENEFVDLFYFQLFGWNKPSHVILELQIFCSDGPMFLGLAEVWFWRPSNILEENFILWFIFYEMDYCRSEVF